MEKLKEFNPFFPNESVENLKEYKYQAVDKSIIGKYFYQDYVVTPALKILPTWIAPNVITVSGGIFILLALITTYCQEFFGRWTHLIVGILFYIYVLFDTLDGKQARRTKNGSPLGELMDHGVDVLVLGILAIILCREYGLDQLQTSYIFFIGYIMFYLPHWIQHQTGWMIFGPESNPIELVHFYLFLEIIRTIFGLTSDLARESKFLGLITYPYFLMGFGTFVMVCIVISSINEVRKEAQKNKKDWSPALKEFIPFFATNIVSWMINYITIENPVINQLRLLGSGMFVGMFVQLYIVTRLL